MIVYNHYCNGNIKCNICGKINIKYLTIDHINGGGRKHTKEIGIVLVKWIIDNNFPPGFQILCMNCQWKKRKLKNYKNGEMPTWKKSKNKQRNMVLNHYCNNDIKCQKCGEKDISCLSIDHINGDGAKHRKQIGRHIERWIIKNNFPNDFQILCFNCQWIKAIENKEFNWSK